MTGFVVDFGRFAGSPYSVLFQFVTQLPVNKGDHRDIVKVAESENKVRDAV